MLRNRSRFNRISNLGNRSSFRRATRNRKADYNGWANWPTWYLSMILVSDEDSEYIGDLARTALKEYKDYPKVYIGDVLKERAEEIMFNLDGVDRNSLAAEMADYALQMVDFVELGEAVLDRAKYDGLLDEEEDEEED